MKKVIITILVFVFIITSATPCHAKKHVNHTHTHVRYMDGSWYCYDSNTRLLYIQTDDGNLWTVKTDWTQFNRMRVTVKFDTQGTKRVTDDRIIKISLIK